MGKISQERKIKKYYNIFEQIYDNPTISVSGIGQNTGISRNTVSTYIPHMYTNQILVGPHIQVNPSLTYKEYVYLLNIKNPLQVYTTLTVPHVLSHAVTVGDWNTILVTDKLMDFSFLPGFQTVVYQGMKYRSYSHKAQCSSWDTSFQSVYDHITPLPYTSECQRGLSSLTWGPDEWTLYHTFKSNVRKKVLPTLQKIDVSYETYTKWKKNLNNCCTVHTGFYPRGYQHYLCYCFLVSTEYEQFITSLFSQFPTTSFIMEVDKQLLIFTHICPSTVKSRLFYLLYDMETIRLIKKFHQALVLHSSHIPCK